jgi:hypothetical protein
VKALVVKISKSKKLGADFRWVLGENKPPNLVVSNLQKSLP